MTFLFFFAFILRITYCAAIGSLGDFTGRGYTEYIVAGQRLLEQGTFISPFITEAADASPSALLPPVYVAFVAGVYALLGINTFSATLVLQVVNAAATSLAVAFVFLITWKLSTPLTAWLAALIATINPTLFAFTDYIWDTGLFTLGTILAVWASVQLPTRRTGPWSWLGLGLFLGALALLNPALTVAYPL
ncbi:MAG: hypothetical protein IIA44_09535, partial [Acidobacteria bacterium]|nr:hypothetical protein [Acidobacteriota bacterium]